MPMNENEQRQKLAEIVKEAVAFDNALRDQHQIGDKFKFVRDRLQALLTQLEEHIEAKQKEEKQAVVTQEDEVLMYIYLYNAQGMTLQTWVGMLSPKLFYEYSVNRPIYSTRDHIESLIRSKSNRAQHAFITVAVKQQDVIKSDNPALDILGHPLDKVREGSLKFDRLVCFTHNDVEYAVQENCSLIKKN